MNTLLNERNNPKLNKHLFGIFPALLLLITCDFGGSDKKGVAPSPYVPTEYSLYWSDEFNYQGLPDPSKWNFDTWGNSIGWGNNELQHYTSGLTENAEIRNGMLHITALKKSISGKNYTSARLSSVNQYKYGYYEVRAKMPGGQGTWPALWMTGTYWPENGEIDLLEHFDGKNTLAASNIHWGNDSYHGQAGPAYQNVPTMCTDFHIYWLRWEAGSIEIGVDSTTVLQAAKPAGAGTDRWAFDTYAENIILNLAIGGGGGPVDDGIFPRTLEIDYVRIYKKN
ncbi:MAG: glycoside hydrolase family 16 protein [Spirochaetes bacterium]|nr:glycoside hydrolase family 16 protein [Spirochaetota bacterium]